eukprot:SAG22_NODE_557_length_9118_cov_9.050006_5_plen_80_part_00
MPAAVSAVNTNLGHYKKPVKLYTWLYGCNLMTHVSINHRRSDKTRGNHMMSTEIIWFHPGLVSVLTYGSHEYHRYVHTL